MMAITLTGECIGGPYAGKVFSHYSGHFTVEEFTGWNMKSPLGRIDSATVATRSHEYRWNEDIRAWVHG